jgi:hypothetical protein
VNARIQGSECQIHSTGGCSPSSSLRRRPHVPRTWRAYDHQFFGRSRMQHYGRVEIGLGGSRRPGASASGNMLSYFARASLMRRARSSSDFGTNLTTSLMGHSKSKAQRADGGRVSSELWPPKLARAHGQSAEAPRRGEQGPTSHLKCHRPLRISRRFAHEPGLRRSEALTAVCCLLSAVCCLLKLSGPESVASVYAGEGFIGGHRE